MQPIHLAWPVLCVVLTGACGSDPSSESDSGDCIGGKCDAPGAGAEIVCEVEDLSESEAGLEGLSDPVVRGVFSSGACPRSFSEVLGKLQQTDAEDCAPDFFSEVQTMFVSERSQLRGEPDSFRAVTRRTCGGRPPHGLLFSSFGLRVGEPLPDNVEVIGLDDAGGFNYYALEDGTWRFFGRSSDLLRGPGDGEVRRCAACHPGGGLVMKELASPWFHWEGQMTTPGARELVDEHPDLGSRGDGMVLEVRPHGQQLEQIIKAGNAAWTPHRVDHAIEHGSVADLLRPLLCTQEINLEAGAKSPSAPSGTGEPAGEDFRVLAARFFIDPQLSSFETLAVPVGPYEDAIADAKQTIVDAGGEQVLDAQGRPLVDQNFDLVFPRRAAVDVEYVKELTRRGIIDTGFVQDVLMVDFTRPVFSDARCALLDFAPDLPPERRNARAIAEGFATELAGAPDTPATATLRAHLASDASHFATTKAFISACQSRPPEELAADLVRVASQYRQRARQMPILEFAETLPVDELDVPDDLRLDPETCILE